MDDSEPSMLLLVVSTLPEPHRTVLQAYADGGHEQVMREMRVRRSKAFSLVSDARAEARNVFVD